MIQSLGRMLWQLPQTCVALLWPLPLISVREKATLRYAYGGEVGRGIFAAVATAFALVVARSHFNVESKYLIWCLSSSVFLGMIVSLFIAPLAARHRRKRVVLLVEVAARLAILAAAMATTGPAFVVSMSLGIAFSALAMPIMSGIYSVNFRSEVRGQCLGRLIAVMIAATAVTGALAGWLMDCDTEYYRMLLAAVSVLGIGCSWYSNRHIPEARLAARRSHGRALMDYVKVVCGDWAFMYMEFVWFVVGLSNLWLMPIRVLRLEEIGMSEGQIMLANVVIPSLTVLFTIGLWGRLLYRINFGIYRIILSVLFAGGTMIFFATGSLTVVCLGAFVWTVALSGGQLSWRLIATFFTTTNRAAVHMSIHAFLCGVRGIVGPMLALYVHESYNSQFVAELSTYGFLLSALLFIPLVFIMKKRSGRTSAQPSIAPVEI